MALGYIFPPPTLLSLLLLLLLLLPVLLLLLLALTLPVLLILLVTLLPPPLESAVCFFAVERGRGGGIDVGEPRLWHERANGRHAGCWLAAATQISPPETKVAATHLVLL